MPTIMRQMNVISRMGAIYRADKLRGTRLGPNHHSYLLAICREPGMSQDELARQICINKSNVTRHLALLEENGFVERRVSESDKRIMRVYPTEQAKAVLPLLRGILADWNAYITEGLSEAELATFQSTLEKIALRATAYTEESEGPAT